MAKPLNVRYVYPMTAKKMETELPENLQNSDLLAIVVIESERPDDLLYDAMHVNKLRSHILESMQRISGLKVLVLLPKSL